MIPTSSDEEASEVKPAPMASTDEDLQQSFVAFTLAARNPNFTQTVAKAAKNFDDLCATVPGLDKDPIACSFLSKVRFSSLYSTIQTLHFWTTTTYV